MAAAKRRPRLRAQLKLKSLKDLKIIIERGGLGHTDCLDRADLEERARIAVRNTCTMVAALHSDEFHAEGVDLARLQVAGRSFKRAQEALRSDDLQFVQKKLGVMYVLMPPGALFKSLRLKLVEKLVQLQWAACGPVAGAGPGEIGLPQGGVIGGGGPAILALLDAREAYAFAREDWALEHPKVKAAGAAVEAAQAQLPGPPIQWPPVADHGPRRHAQRSPRGRDDSRGAGTVRPARAWRRAPDHRRH